MAIITKRIPHFQKPEGPVEIDWSKVPASLKAAWIFNEGAGDPLDLVSNRAAVLQSSSWDIASLRRAIIHDATTDRTQLAADSSQILPTQSITILFGYQKRDATRRLNGALGVDGATDAQRCGAHIDWGGGSFTGNIIFDFGGITEGDTRLTVDLDNETLAKAYALTTGPRGMEIWQDGIKKASNSANPSRTQTTNAYKLGTHGGNDSDLANYFFCYIFHEQLPEVLLTQWTESIDFIYQTIKPRRRWVPFSSGGTTFNQAVSGSITPSGILATALTIAQSLAGSITSTGALTFITSFKQTLTGSISSTGILARKISTSVEGSITATGSVLKKTIRDLAGSITSTGTLASELSSDILKTVAGSITATGALTKKVFRSLSGSVSSTGDITKKTSTDLDGSISMSGDPDKGMAQDTSGSITPTGDLTASAPFVPAPDEGGGAGSDGSLAQRIRRVYGYFKRYGR